MSDANEVNEYPNVNDEDRNIAMAYAESLPESVLNEELILQLAGHFSAYRRSLAAAQKTIAELEAEAKSLKDRVATLTSRTGLMADDLIHKAVSEHISEGYKKLKPDACFSAQHRVFETGDALNGSSVVVSWSNREKDTWFHREGDEVIAEEFQSSEQRLHARSVEACILYLRDTAKGHDDAALASDAAGLDLEADGYRDIRDGYLRSADLLEEYYERACSDVG